MEKQTDPKLVKLKEVDSTFDISKHLQNEIKNSKYFKYILIFIATVGGLYTLGYVFKVVSYTVHNYKNLVATSKR
jgi:hypothetical protein